MVCAAGLGDALLSLILSHNLQLSGYKVTTFSSALGELKGWFPTHTLLPYPPPSCIQETFAPFSLILASDHHPIPLPSDTRVVLIEEKACQKSLTWVQNLALLCKDLPHHGTDNGLVVPSPYKWRKYPQRVIIHPMSLELKRRWLKKKFLKLSFELEKRGFEPIFCMSAKERLDWISEVPERQLPYFSTLPEAAALIYESGYLIGNNSGLGHLASLFQVPTLSLFAKKSYACLWRPGWGPGEVVTPLSLFPGKIRQDYWKHLLSVKRVLNHFIKLSKGGVTLTHPPPCGP